MASGQKTTWMLTGPAILFLAVFFLVPVSWLLGLSVFDEGSLTAANYQRLADQPLYARLLGITLTIAGWTTLLAVVGGYPVAFLIARTRDWRGILLLLVLLPFWTSFLVRAFSWMVLLGRRGALNQFLEGAGLIDAPLALMFNLTGVLVAMAHAMLPLAVMTMLPVMLNIDRRLLLASQTLGAKPGSVFWRIWFPLSMPGVAAAGILVFVTSLGFFITPALLGSERETVIVQEIIFQIQQLLNWGFAGAIGVLVLVTVLAILAFYNAVFGFAGVAGSARQATSKPLLSAITKPVGNAVLGGLARVTDALYDALAALRLVGRSASAERGPGYPLRLVTALILGFLIVPTLFIVPVSFTEASFLSWPPRGFSLQWFGAVAESAVWQEAALRSVLVALLAASLGLAIGVPAAFALARRSFRGKQVLFALTVAPVVVPNIFIAVGLFYLFSRLGLTSTTVGLALGHAVLAIPYVVVTMMAVVRDYDERLDYAAYTLGANKLRTLVEITLPLIRPGLVSAFMFAFIISFDELTIALFLTGGTMITLPKKMWDDAVLQVSPELAAASVLLMAFMTCVILAAELFRRRAARIKAREP
ncbi:MAG: ABC transporter permease subunit [Devosiaceae bacterium]|nr:ABC transporter permease subunit [Devosiaceae bacterium MH13]